MYPTISQISVSEMLASYGATKRPYPWMFVGKVSNDWDEHDAAVERHLLRTDHKLYPIREADKYETFTILWCRPEKGSEENG